MIRGPEGLIYVGSEPPYGQLGGAMAVWDPKQNRVIENHRHIITNQSIVSLAFDPGTGLIFGGSGNFGGGGTRPTEKEAKFFAFDPKQKKKVFETSFVPGARSSPLREASCLSSIRARFSWRKPSPCPAGKSRFHSIDMPAGSSSG
jgi:hypothetical protein